MTDTPNPASVKDKPEGELPDDGNKRSQDHALTDEEKLELGVEDSMEASDPPSVVAPGDDGEPHPSSGYRE